METGPSGALHRHTEEQLQDFYSRPEVQLCSERITPSQPEVICSFSLPDAHLQGLLQAKAHLAPLPPDSSRC
jgi:hypothetical protein